MANGIKTVEAIDYSREIIACGMTGGQRSLVACYYNVYHTQRCKVACGVADRFLMMTADEERAIKSCINPESFKKHGLKYTPSCMEALPALARQHRELDTGLNTGIIELGKAPRIAPRIIEFDSPPAIIEL